MHRPKRNIPSTRQRSAFRTHLPLISFLAVLWLVCTDDRHVGAIADGRQMIWTAVAITESGGLEQSPRDFTYTTASGASVSRFGMGMSLAQIPASLLAPVVEKRLGAASSQPLFLLAPLLAMLAACVCSASIVRHLGGTLTAERIAILLSGLGSPLGAYATLEFSEPLQAFALAAALACALIASSADRDRLASKWTLLAGVAAGVALLTKSNLIAVAPFALLPLLAVRTTTLARTTARAAMGFAIPAVVWLIFELVRFGRPFAGYEGERFSHPFADGLWRLLIGGNKGLLWYFPAVLAAVWGIVLLIRSGDRRRKLAAAAIALPGVALLVMAAAWWAWHGAEGWGPRLLVPALPALAACAALPLASAPRVAQIAVLLISSLANALPLLQHPTPVAAFVNACTWPAVDRVAADRIAPYARDLSDPAHPRVHPDVVLTTTPAATPFRTYSWLLQQRFSSSDSAVTAPPWVDVRPDISLQGPLPAAVILSLESVLGYWGRTFRPDPRQSGYMAVYDEALADQVILAQTRGEASEALRLARKLERVAPSPASVPLLLESLRINGDVDEARRWLGSLPRERRADPRVNVVLALFERDRGNEEGARQFLGSVAAEFPGSEVSRAMAAPIAAWPRDLHRMTGSITRPVR